MRLPFPERIPLPLSMLAAMILFGLQQLQKTSLTFSIYCFIFIITATLAFNLAGGFTRPSGSYVFFYAVLGVILGMVFKAYLGEAADSNLTVPLLTMQVHTGAMVAMLGAVILSRKLSLRKPLLGNLLKEKDMRSAAIGSLLVGSVIFFLSIVVPHEGGSALTALTQINRFFLLATILATIRAIKTSGGRKPYDSLLIFIMVVNVLIGFVNFGKEAMFTPWFCWLFTAASLRYRMRPRELVGVAVIVFICVTYLVPYSQYGRNFIPETGSFSDRAAVSISLLENLSYVREQYHLEQQESFDEVPGISYFNVPMGFAGRLTMVPIDDMLINYTEQGHVEGYTSIGLDFMNWVPHFIWPDKPTGGGGGNFYANEIGGIIPEGDTTTGISFTAAAEAYHLGRWVGVFALAPVIWTMLFVIFDSLCGDSRRAPWGLMIIAVFAHTAPEGMLSGAIYTMWFGSIGVIFAALSASYVLPIVGTLIVGPEKTGLVRGTARPFARRQSPLIRPSDASG
jgi:hypothetical protein